MKKIIPALPQWLLEYLPSPRPQTKLSYRSGKYWLSHTPTVAYDTVTEAYDAVPAKGPVAISFDRSLKKAGKLSKNLGMLFVPFKTLPGRPEKTGGRILISSTDEDLMGILVSDYEEWLILDRKYQKNKNNWRLAYNWIKMHPAFWYPVGKIGPFFWATDDGHKSVWVNVENTKTNKSVRLEHGNHVAPEYKTFYHDPNLDVNAKTLEKAYVKLAKQINKYYNVDGTSKQDDDKEKPVLV